MNTNTRALSALLPTANAAASESRAAAAPVAPGMDFASLMSARVQATQSAQASTAQQQHATPSDVSHRNAGNTAAQDQTRALADRRERERVQDRAADNRAQQAATEVRQQAARSSAARQANTAKPAAVEAQEAVGEEDTNPAITDDKPLATTPLAEWLASLNPATMQLPPEQGDGATTEDALAAVDGHERSPGGAQRNAGLRRGTNAADADAAGDTKNAAEADERFELPAQAQAAVDAQATQLAARTEGAASAASKSSPDAMAAVTDITAPTPGATGPSEATASTQLDVPTPATDADFPDVLATQVSVLVKDGVQQAELHLNPAEMGPISVQIAVDGSQAQVDFAAATGATRELIETSLPMLAAALHEAGLTLVGGGVFEHGRHAGGTAHDGASSSSQRGGAQRQGDPVEATAASQPAARRVAMRGTVDLYA